jgi:hypothetical protein
LIEHEKQLLLVDAVDVGTSVVPYQQVAFI